MKIEQGKFQLQNSITKKVRDAKVYNLRHRKREILIFPTVYVTYGLTVGHLEVKFSNYFFSSGQFSKKFSKV